MPEAPGPDAQPQACCAKCKKTGVELTPCERCDVGYCSRSCQVSHWKAHKKTCARNRDNKPPPGSSSDASSSAAARGLGGPNALPFTRIDKGTYLHGRPEGDVYKLLIDTYRLRLDDDFNLQGIQEPGSIYASAQNDPLPGFRRFLDKAAGVLPPWWGEDKRQECEALGASSGWSSLRKKLSKQEVIAHYGEDKFPMQLRMLGEAIYGRGPGGQDGTAMRQMLVMTEARTFRGDVHHIDANRLG